MPSPSNIPCQYYPYIKDGSGTSSLPIKPEGATRFVVVSDTHGNRPELPPAGDCLIHTGDFTIGGRRERFLMQKSLGQEVQQFREWLDTLTQFKTKIIISGNHDLPFDPAFYASKWHKRQKVFEEPEETVAILDSEGAREHGIVFANDRWAEVEGWTVYGCPWLPDFGSIMRWLGIAEYAFMIPRGDPLRAKYSPLTSFESTQLLAKRPDILLTHGPPHGILDVALTGHVGCEDLMSVVKRIRPRVHCFGHIHEAYGTLEQDGTLFVNSANVDLRYNSVNAPVVIDLGPRLE